MGYPASDLDDASFSAAAVTIYGEGFGLSLLLNREETIESLVLAILEHIDGVLYVHLMASADPTLGLSYDWTLGESGWKDGMDANFKRLGVVVGLAVKDRDIGPPPAGWSAGVAI